MKYGLISETDGKTLEKTIDLICSSSDAGAINICEVGCYAGTTGAALSSYIKSKGREFYSTGIENNRDGELMIHTYDNLIIGNSSEVYNQLEDNSQHLIFIDALHTFAGVVSDFFCYAPKVKVGGYLAFHDTGTHIDPLHGWQGVGDRNDPDFCLWGVRKALIHIGLFNVKSDAIYFDMLSKPKIIGNKNWELIFDESDKKDLAGGICVFKKLY